MKAEIQEKLALLLKDDEVLCASINEHNKKVEATLLDETKTLKDQGAVHEAKAQEFIRELGIDMNIMQRGNLIQIVQHIAEKISVND